MNEDDYSVQITDADIEYDADAIRVKKIVLDKIAATDCIVKMDLLGLWCLMDMVREAEQRGREEAGRKVTT